MRSIEEIKDYAREKVAKKLGLSALDIVYLDGMIDSFGRDVMNSDYESARSVIGEVGSWLNAHGEDYVPDRQLVIGPLRLMMDMYVRDWKYPSGAGMNMGESMNNMDMPSMNKMHMQHLDNPEYQTFSDRINQIAMEIGIRSRRERSDNNPQLADRLYQVSTELYTLAIKLSGM